MAVPDRLPLEMRRGARLLGNEYGWAIPSFPEALEIAEGNLLACLGGQFRFHLPDAVCEMYWLKADSGERRPEESWPEYSQRSCSEVRAGFEKLVKTIDFRGEALEWPLLKQMIESGYGPMNDLVFIAYFVSEQEMK